MNNIVNHKQGERHRPGTLVRWVNNTIARVQNDGRHLIVANLNKSNKKRSKQLGGKRCNMQKYRQNKQRKTNQQKLWYCCVGITMIVILIFFIIISIALWMN